MKIFELRNDPVIIDWFNIIKSKSTLNNYAMSMQLYTSWIQKTPTELIEEAETEAALVMRKRHIRSYLINFRAFFDIKGTCAIVNKKLYDWCESVLQI